MLAMSLHWYVEILHCKFTFGQVQFSILCCNNTEILVWLGLVLKACLFEVRKVSCFVLPFTASVATNMAGKLNFLVVSHLQTVKHCLEQCDLQCDQCDMKVSLYDRWTWYHMFCQSLVNRNIKCQCSLNDPDRVSVCWVTENWFSLLFGLCFTLWYFTGCC